MPSKNSYHTLVSSAIGCFVLYLRTIVVFPQHTIERRAVFKANPWQLPDCEIRARLDLGDASVHSALRFDRFTT